MKLKSNLMKKGLFLIAVLVIASVSAVAVGMSGLVNDNEASVTFKLVGVGPNRPPGWPNITHTWGGNFTLDSPLEVYVYTLDGKPYNTTVPNLHHLDWDELPFPPLEERDDYKRRTFGNVSGICYSANGSIIMTFNIYSNGTITCQYYK